jgi:hypothetical protein
MGRARTPACLAALTAVAAIFLAGCGGGSTGTGTEDGGGDTAGYTQSQTANPFSPTAVAHGVEREIAVHGVRCHRPQGADGRHFTCLAHSGPQRFRLAVAVREAQGSPVITSCKSADFPPSPNGTSTCAFPGKGGGGHPIQG